MRQNRSSLAALMIGVGMLFLIDRFAWAAGVSNILWSLVFFAVAAVLVWLYTSDTTRWWALFPGFAALAVALAILAGNVGGLVLLALSGLICLTLYFTDQSRRWALLFGGGLMSLALMAFFEMLFPPADNGWWLFLGLALTFVALYLRRPQGAGSWQLYAAIVMAAMAILSLLTGRLVETLIALMLMAGGALVLWREADGAGSRGETGAARAPGATGLAPATGAAQGDGPTAARTSDAATQAGVAAPAPVTPVEPARPRGRSRWGRGSSG